MLHDVVQRKKFYTLVLQKCLTRSVLADTVYYNGTAIYWSHGRTAGVYSYSTVQTSVYTHGATANSTFSGWKSPGVTANAKQYVGLGQAVAYWNVK